MVLLLLLLLEDSANQKGKERKSGGRDLTRNEVALALLSMRLIEIMG